jgi:hypothetical protein
MDSDAFKHSRVNPMTVRMSSTVRIDSSRNPMLYGKMGGGGVASVCRYLCTRPHSEKAKKEQHGNDSETRKRKTKGKRQDDHTEVC